MDEHELKYMLDEEGYRACRNALSKVCGCGGRERILVNYYYDTPKRCLHKAGITLRIRQLGTRLQGQIKRHDKIGGTDSRESYFDVEELPASLVFEGRKARLLGSLTTYRTVFEHEGLEMDLDAVYYMGRSDFELEIEYGQGQEDRAREFAASLGVPFLPKQGGKFSRFLKALKQAEKAGPVPAEVNPSGVEL